MPVLLGLLALVSAQPNVTLRSVRLLTQHPKVLSVVEFEVVLAGEVSRPFDRTVFALDGLVRDSNGKTVRVPGFLYQPYRRMYREATRPIAYASTDALAKGKSNTERKPNTEVLEPTAAPTWRIRIAPLRPGPHTLEVQLRVDGVTRKLPASKFVVEKAERSAAGFIGRSKNNPLAFVRSTGESYFPLGANICWGNESGSADYDRWLPRYGDAGANWGRVWLGPAWTTFALETAGSDEKAKFGGMNLANAWRLDYVLGEAGKRGIAIEFAIDSYNVIRDRVAWPEWERSPYNKATGGPLTQPSEFWTNESAKAHYKNKLAYIVARWGAHTNVFAWEFWNEVDGVADYKVGPIREWHALMAKHLKAIDPYHHLISTSFGGDGRIAEDVKVFELADIDITKSHIYNSPDIASSVSAERARLGKLGKPWFVGETGMDSAGPREKDDPRGYQLHDALWASIASGASGGAMLWWWDSYVDPMNLYPQLTAAKKFLDGVNWDKADVVPVRCDGGYAAAGKDLFVVWVPKQRGEVRLPVLPSGKYRLYFWDTWAGKLLASAEVGSSGALNMSLPNFERDLAIKGVRLTH